MFLPKLSLRFATLAALFLLAFAAVHVSRAADAQKPNIIFILADDMGYGDIEPFGSTKNRTPNLDRMAKEGMRLTSFYAAPVCSPSRAQILTGCYAKRVSIPQVLMPRSKIGLNTNENTIGKLMKEAGYATEAIGKWHVGDSPENLPTRFGFDHYLGLPYSNDMGGEVPGKDEPPRRNGRPPLPLVRDEQVIEIVRPRDQDRLEERYTAEALKFIREHSKQPFFLYFPHTAVHVPLHPGDHFRGKSGNGLYGDWVEEVDWSVGQVMDTVRELGLTNTLIVFSSDNGPWLTQGTNAGTASPLRGGKAGTYEGGVREPTIAWWPGKIAANTSSDAIAANFDLLPTFVKLAGGTVPTEPKIDGRDIAPLLLGETTDSPHEAHYYFSGNELQAVRSGPWKLAILPQYEGRGVKPTESKIGFVPRLYNLDTDIGERTDVAAAHPDIVRHLQEYIAKMDADLGGEKLGPGVRPPGHIAHPLGLWLPGHGPAEISGAPARLEDLGRGDSLNGDDAPRIAGKAFSVSCQVQTKARDGVIIAHGGIAYGYTIYLRDGRLHFAVREQKNLVSIATTSAAPKKFTVTASLAADGAMMLSVDGQEAANGQAKGVISKQPSEDFCVGFDDARPVADYVVNKLPSGKISGVAVAINK
jgi:arylsulfatase A